MQQDPETPIGAEADPAGDRARPRTSTRRKVAGAVAAAVLVLALVVSLLVWRRADGPDDVVRAYLTAILDREVDQALRIAKADRPAGESGAFLTAKAIGGGWRIGTTTVRNEFEDRAEVEITLVDTSGRPALAPQRYRGTFELTREDGDWRITNPFVEVGLVDTPLRYVEVGEFRLPRERPTPAGGPVPKYHLFPGLYVSYGGPSELVTVAPETLTALPGNGGYPANNPVLTATDRGNRAFQQASDALLDECLAALAKREEDCLPESASRHYETSHGYVMKSDVRTSTWKLVRHPTVNLPGTQTHSGDGLLVFSGQVAIPGELRLTATGRTLEGGRQVSFTMACLVTKLQIGAAVRADGSMSAAWLAEPGQRNESSAPKRISVDCY